MLSLSGACSLLLQVKAGVDILTLKRKYKEMAVTLHPDKCKVRWHFDPEPYALKAFTPTITQYRLCRSMPILWLHVHVCYKASCGGLCWLVACCTTTPARCGVCPASP